MASPKSTLPNSQEEQDSAYNPGELRYSEENIGGGRSDDPGNGSPDHTAVQGAEAAGNPVGGERPDYINRVTGNKRSRESRWAKVFIFAQRRGGVLGLLGFLGISGGLMAGFFGPSSMLIGLMENLSITNDSSSTTLERRFMKAFSFANIGDPVCANNSRVSLKCKMGRISNSALYKLSKQGMTAYFEGSVTYDGKKTGYPARNPAGYTFDLRDGSPPRNVPVADLSGFLVDNPEAAAKLLGRSGAFNLRFKAWTGRHITSKLFDPFNLKRDGGLADGKNGQLSGPTKRDSIFEKLRERLPGGEEIGNVADGVKEKVSSHLGKAKAGGAAYMTAVVGCIGVKAPAYIAGGVAAVQLAQILPVSMDVVLSPGAKAKAAGFDSGFTGEDQDAVATILTERTPRESDGKMTSALDSPYLLAAMGVNKNSPPASQEFTPGYSILTDPLVRAASEADKALEPACSVILSPAAMYTALAVNSIATVALSATIVGGIVKVLADFVITEVAAAVAVEVAGDAAKTALVELAKSDAIPNAEGEALGEVIGISAPALFSAGGMVRNIPTLSEAQLGEAEVVRQENEAFRAEMDIASLSPFDISSRYTFLGSIVNDMRLAMVSNGGYGNIASMLSGLSSIPIATLSPNANADDLLDKSCRHADEFYLNTGDPTTTPALNVAGLPCVGMTPEQAAMSTAEAMSLLEEEGWIDQSKPVYDGDLIEDLVEREVIVSDTPLANFIDSCSHPETGDYLFNSPGCIVNSDPESLGTSQCVEVAGEDGPTEICAGDDLGGEVPEGVKNPRSMLAMSALLIDYQNVQIFNGEDEGDATAGNSPGTIVSPVSPGATVTSSMGPRPRPCPTCQPYHQGTDFFSGDKAVFSIMDGVVESAGSGVNNIVKIRHDDGLISQYWHMRKSDILVQVGDTVTAGQRIGVMGNEGQSVGVHLHFELDISGLSDADLEHYQQYKISTGGSDKGKRIDPEDFFAKNGVEGF